MDNDDKMAANDATYFNFHAASAATSSEPGGILKFDGEDPTHAVSKWIQDIEDNAEIFSWTEQQKLIMARRSLKGTAELWLRAERTFRTFEELKTAITREFPDAVNVKEMHEVMAARKKRNNETFYQYMLTMKELGKRAKFPDYVSIQYIIDGIPDPAFNKTILYEATTYSKLKEKLKIYEEIKEKSKTTRVHERSEQTRVQRKMCYGCGEKGHVSRECPHKQKGVKCFRCNRFGHISSHCQIKMAEPQPNSTGQILYASSEELSDRTKCTVSDQRQVTSSDAICQSVTFDRSDSGDRIGNERMDALTPANMADVNKECEIMNRKPMKNLLIGGKTISALIDTGCDLNLMAADCYATVCATISLEDDKVFMSGLGATQVNSLGRFTAEVSIDGQCYENVVFHVIPRDAMPFAVILGHEFLQNVTFVLEGSRIVVFKPNEAWLQNFMFGACISDVSGYLADSKLQKTVQQLVDGYKPAQMYEPPIELRIVLKDDIPVAQRPRRLAFKEQQEVEKHVVRFPQPITLKQLHSFIGLTSYFCKFIPNFALIAKPLTDLLKKNCNFTFDEHHRVAFRELKLKLSCSPVLKIYNPLLPTELHTDASIEAYAAILLQRCPEDEQLHPVYYMSRKTNDAERKYTSYELEALAIIEGIKKFRPYLYGIKFKIVTDCQAFEMTLKKKDLCTRVARWVLLLQEYDYEVEHRTGSQMRHVDALSRAPYVGVVTRDLHEQIRRAQELDEGITAIKEILRERPYDDYRCQDGVLYKGIQLVIPTGMEQDIIRKIHSNGHFSKKKMLEMMSGDYYIRELPRKIEEFIITCVPCLLATKKSGKEEGFLQCIEKASIPLHTLHLDHIGPLTETKKQYNYILTMVDAFTKFVWLFPTKSTSTQETLSKLQIHQQTFGNPYRIITDRGTAFTSNDFQNYCERENIIHVKVTTGVPRGNGQVERIHRTIIPMLTKLCLEDKSVWYRHVSRVQRALNSTFQRAIKRTPFELLVGAKMRITEDLELLALLEQEESQCYQDERENLRRDAKEQILKLQDENRKNFNRRRKESMKYAIGDLVAIKRTQFGPAMKLKSKYLGPYKVTKVKGQDRYDVEKADGSTEGSINTSTSADNMKRWPDGGD